MDLHRWGCAREAVDRDAKWDHRPVMEVPVRFPGVFVLFREGAPVFIGKAADPEGAIEVRRKGLSFIPRVEFDEVEIHRAHPDQIDLVYHELKDRFWSKP